jgi:hypothetical protein
LVGKSHSARIEVQTLNTFYGIPFNCDFEANVSLTLNISVKSDDEIIKTVIVYDPSRIIIKEGANKIMYF